MRSYCKTSFAFYNELVLPKTSWFFDKQDLGTGSHVQESPHTLVNILFVPNIMCVPFSVPLQISYVYLMFSKKN